jgi:hypothetical protein
MQFTALISAFALSLTVFLPSVSYAAVEAKEFEYPELLVSPSASERLAAEAKNENKRRWSAHWAIQASALTTLLAGMSSSGDPGVATKDGSEKKTKIAGTMATYIGAIWLGTTGVMSATYTPYQTGMAGLKGMAQGTKKEKLAYERRAEEALYAPSSVATVMKWTAFISNLTANALVMSSATQGSTKLMGSIGILGSILPVAFEHEWNSVERYQNEYKKRIYGPLTDVSISIVPHNNVMAGMTSLTFDF